LSEEVPELIALILKRLANKCNPYEIINLIRPVFDDDTEVRNIFI